MGTPRIRRALPEDSDALATLVPGGVPPMTDPHHAIFVIDQPFGPPAVLDLQQAEHHLELLHFHAPDLMHAKILQDFAEQAARALGAREIRLTAHALDDAQAAALGYRHGRKRVRPAGVPLWRDGTAPFSQSLYFRGVWSALALLVGLGSVSVAVFNSRTPSLLAVTLPALLCVGSALFAAWQIVLIIGAARRTTRWLFAVAAVLGLATVGLIGLIMHERALPALAELWAIHSGDQTIGALEVEMGVDGQTLYVSGTFRAHSEDTVQQALTRNPAIRTVVLQGPGGRIAVGIALFRMFRERTLRTRVDRDCASACTLAFLGGVQRTVSRRGRLGFHAASFPGMGEGDMQDTNRDIRNFLIHTAGLTPAFASRVIETPANSIWVPTYEELMAGKVILP
jgi:hypothetical protein